MKIRDFNSEGFADRLFEIPPETEVSFRVISEPEFLAQHFDAAKKKFFACIGKDKNCPYCPDETMKKRFICYVKDVDDSIKLAAMPYMLFKFLKETLESNPEKFDDNELPKFYVKAFRSGKGKETLYHFEMDVVDESEIDTSKLDPVTTYVETEKLKTHLIVDKETPQDQAEIKINEEGETVPF